METKVKIGIIICDRYKSCAGGKCFQALNARDGAFARYQDQDVEIAAYTSCGGCPGGNIEYAPAEMQKNGVSIIHFATGFLVGYPPCPYMEHFERLIKEKYQMEVVFGTHPIPQKYYLTHQKLESWQSPQMRKAIAESLSSETVRLTYD